MSPQIKKFIEDNIDLLDKDLTEFFIKSNDDYMLAQADIAYMSAILSEAGITQINEARDRALLYIMDQQVLEWSSGDSGVSSMPVYDFIEAFLGNCVGYNLNFVLLFVIEHAPRWEKYVKIYKPDNMTIIELK